jgi:hypothetical protein
VGDPENRKESVIWLTLSLLVFPVLAWGEALPLLSLELELAADSSVRDAQVMTLKKNLQRQGLGWFGEQLTSSEHGKVANLHINPDQFKLVIEIPMGGTGSGPETGSILKALGHFHQRYAASIQSSRGSMVADPSEYPRRLQAGQAWVDRGESVKLWDMPPPSSATWVISREQAVQRPLRLQNFMSSIHAEPLADHLFIADGGGGITDRSLGAEYGRRVKAGAFDVGSIRWTARGIEIPMRADSAEALTDQRRFYEALWERASDQKLAPIKQLTQQSYAHALAPDPARARASVFLRSLGLDPKVYGKYVDQFVQARKDLVKEVSRRVRSPEFRRLPAEHQMMFLTALTDSSWQQEPSLVLWVRSILSSVDKNPLLAVNAAELLARSDWMNDRESRRLVLEGVNEKGTRKQMLLSKVLFSGDWFKDPMVLERALKGFEENDSVAFALGDALRDSARLFEDPKASKAVARKLERVLAGADSRLKENALRYLEQMPWKTHPDFVKIRAMLPSLLDDSGALVQKIALMRLTELPGWHRHPRAFEGVLERLQAGGEFAYRALSTYDWVKDPRVRGLILDHVRKAGADDKAPPGLMDLLASSKVLQYQEFRRALLDDGILTSIAQNSEEIDAGMLRLMTSEPHWIQRQEFRTLLKQAFFDETGGSLPKLALERFHGQPWREFAETRWAVRKAFSLPYSPSIPEALKLIREEGVGADPEYRELVRQALVSSDGASIREGLAVVESLPQGSQEPFMDLMHHYAQYEDGDDWGAVARRVLQGHAPAAPCLDFVSRNVSDR